MNSKIIWLKAWKHLTKGAEQAASQMATPGQTELTAESATIIKLADWIDTDCDWLSQLMQMLASTQTLEDYDFLLECAELLQANCQLYYRQAAEWLAAELDLTLFSRRLLVLETLLTDFQLALLLRQNEYLP